MGIYVKFTKTTHQIWSCHVTLAWTSKHFYLSPNFVLNFWLKNKKNYRQETNWGGKHPSPSAYRVKDGGKLWTRCFQLIIIFRDIFIQFI